MNYILDGKVFSISYKELRERHMKFCDLPDDEFLKNLPAVLHLACIICWFKEIPTETALSDTGIIHQLAHLIDNTDSTVTNLCAIRADFQEVLFLA